MNYIQKKAYKIWNELQPYNKSLNLWLLEKWVDDYILAPYFLDDKNKIYFDIFSVKAVNCEVIKYLTNKYGEEFLYRYYKTLINRFGWFLALSHVIDDPGQVWLLDFFKQFFRGKIYPVTGQVFSDKVFDNPEVTHHIDLPFPNQTASYLENCIDLSAQVFYVNMGSQYINENSLLECSITFPDIDTKNLNGILFSFDRNTKEIKFINDETSSLRIADPIKYKDNNEDLFMVVVNSRSLNMGEDRILKASEIQLDVTLKETFQLTYQRMEIVLDSLTIYRTYLNQPYIHQNQTFSFKIPYGDMYDGSFSDNQLFTTDWDYTDDSQVRYWGRYRPRLIRNT